MRTGTGSEGQRCQFPISALCIARMSLNIDGPISGQRFDDELEPGALPLSDSRENKSIPMRNAVELNAETRL